MVPPRQSTPEESKLEQWARLQGRINSARLRHQDLAGRHRVLLASGYMASATALRDKMRAAESDLRSAQAALLEFHRTNPNILKQA